MFTEYFANEITQARNRAHQCIDTIWRNPNERTLVYQWIAFQFGDREGMLNGHHGRAHIRFLNFSGCERLIALVEQIDEPDRMQFIRAWNEQSRPAFIEPGRVVLNDFIDHRIFFEPDAKEQKPPQEKQAKPKNRSLEGDEEIEFVRQHFENLKGLCAADPPKLNQFYQFLLFQVNEIIFSHYPELLEVSNSEKLDFLHRQKEVHAELFSCFRRAIRVNVAERENEAPALKSSQPKVENRPQKNQTKAKKKANPNKKSSVQVVRADKEQEKSTREWNKKVMADFTQMKSVAKQKPTVVSAQAAAVAVTVKPYYQVELELLLSRPMRLKGTTAKKMFLLCCRLDDLSNVQKKGQEDPKFQELVTEKLLEVAGSIVEKAQQKKSVSGIDRGQSLIKSHLHNIEKFKSAIATLRRVLIHELAEAFISSLMKIIEERTKSVMELLPATVDIDQEDARLRSSEQEALFQIHGNLLLLLDAYASAYSFGNGTIQNTCLARYIKQMSLVFGYLANYVRQIGLSSTKGRINLIFERMTCEFDINQQIAVANLIASQLGEEHWNLKQQLLQKISSFNQLLSQSGALQFQPSNFYPDHYKPDPKVVKLNQADQKVKLQPLFCEIHTSKRKKEKIYSMSNFSEVCKSLIDPEFDPDLHDALLVFCDEIHAYALFLMQRDATSKGIDLRKAFSLAIVPTIHAEKCVHPKTKFSLEQDFWSMVYYSGELMYNAYLEILLNSPIELNQYAMTFVSQVFKEMRQALLSTCEEALRSLETIAAEQSLEPYYVLQMLQILRKKFQFSPNSKFLNHIIEVLDHKVFIYLAKHAELLFKRGNYAKAIEQYEGIIEIPTENRRDYTAMIVEMHQKLVLIYETMGNLPAAEGHKSVIASLNQNKSSANTDDNCLNFG